ncbi:MAG: pyruvate dehydrogenase E2 component (dihydrolipoamide acetyltransferase), partial [Glaciecola sp.]
MADLQDIIVPDVGGEEVEIIEVCLAVGDTVEAEASFVTVESDKASMDIPIPFDGMIKEISVKVGDKIKQGDLLGKALVAQNAPSAELASEAPNVESPAASQPAPATTPAPALTAQSPEAAASSVIEVMVPDIGDASDVEIIEILVNEGDTVAEEDGLITLETDKATMDVPAPAAGKIVSLKVKLGDKVSMGSLVLTMEVAGQGEATQEVQASAPVPAPD